MTSRERVRAALRFNHPDRVPLDLNITMTAYDALTRFLGVGIGDAPLPNNAMEVVPHPDVLAALGVDMISLKMEEPRQRGPALTETTSDGWGITRRLVRQSAGEYYEVISHPLAGATRDDLARYPWPTVGSNGKATRLRAYAERLYRSTELALVGRFGGPILETACDLLGMEEWHIRIATDRAFIADLLDRISAICAAQDLLGLEAAGEFLEVMKVSGEDLGMQTAPLYSPEVFSDLLLPPLARRWAAVKGWLASHQPAVKVMLHSCGAIRDFIPALLSAGIDVLDPVQPLAKGMDPEGLRAAFGGKMIFHGGIDIQRLLPRGSAEEVAQGTRRCLAGFGADAGGFIAAPSHAVQADVPPSNLRVMAEAVRSWKGE